MPSQGGRKWNARCAGQRSAKQKSSSRSRMGRYRQQRRRDDTRYRMTSWQPGFAITIYTVGQGSSSQSSSSHIAVPKNCRSRARRLGQSASGCPAQGQLANRTNVTFKPTREPGTGSAAAQAADASALVSPALPSGVRTRRLCACERWRRFPRRRSQITVRAKIKVGCGAKPSCPARDRRRLQGSNSAICWRQPRASTAAKHRPRPPFPAPATDAGVPCRYDLVSSR